MKKILVPILIFLSLMLVGGENVLRAQAELERDTLTADIVVWHRWVPIGYGKQSENHLTGSVVTLADSSFNQGNIVDPLQLVQGKVPGLLIARPGGDPAEAFQMRLRGISTLEGNPEPLLVIDGLPGASLLELDPFDVARVTVLKDASASAIYGIRAANGVVLIETRKGPNGKLSLQYHGFAALSGAARKPDMLSAIDLRSFYNRLSQDPDFFEQLRDYKSSTDWQKEILRSPAFSQAHQVSASGGKNGTLYRASLTYRNNQGIAKASGLKQLNTRINLSQSLWKDKINLQLILAYNTRDWQDFDYRFKNRGNFYSPQRNEPIRQAVKYNPTAPIRSDLFPEYGGYFQAMVYDQDNPVALLDQTQNEHRQNLFSGRLSIDWKIVEGLTARASYGTQRSDFFHGFDAVKEAYNFQYGGPGAVAYETGEMRNWIADVSLSYAQKWGGHSLQVMGGHAYQYQREEATLKYSDSLPSNDFRYPDLNEPGSYPSGFQPQFSQTGSSLKLSAFFGRAAWEYKGNWFLSGQVRYEGASSLGANQKWGLLYGASAGWNLASLWSESRDQLLKLRIGYGLTGNLPADPYVALSLFEPSFPVYYNGQFIQGYWLAQEGNPDLRMETNREWNIGADFRFWKGRLCGSVEVYQRQHADLLTTVRTAYGQRQTLNQGKLQNEGMELSLTIVPVVTKSFRWELGQVLAFQKTIIKESWGEEDPVYGPAPGIAGRIYPVSRYQEGGHFGEFFGPVLQFIDLDGKWVFRDKDRDGQTGSDLDDFEVLGKALPSASLGHWQRFRMGAFDLEFMLRAVWGHKQLNYYRLLYENPQSISIYNLLQSTTEDNIPSLRDYQVYSSFYVEKAGFARLDYLTAGYTHQSARSKGLQSFRLYVTVQNLFTLTAYQGVDPEVRFAEQGDPLAPGLERENVYFPARTFLLGIRLGL